MTALDWLQTGVASFFEYDTPRIVHIRSKKIGVLSRFVQLCIISYVVGYVMVYNKGYQEKEKLVAAVTSKVKGVLQTEFSDSELVNVPPQWKYLYSRVWDVADFVVPPLENKALFLMTNVVITPNQTRTSCPEQAGLLDCETDQDCRQGESSVLGHGVMTGQGNIHFPRDDEHSVKSHLIVKGGDY